MDGLSIHEFWDLSRVNILTKIIFALFVILISQIILKLTSKILNRKTSLDKVFYKSRAQTLQQVVMTIVKAIVYFVALMTILENFGINTSSILATAGIGGVAIAFGAQTLVKDVISGAFILIEEQYEIGDLVRIGGLEGYVQNLSLRTTSLKDFNGDIHIIQNGSITAVTNRSKENQRIFVEITVSRNNDIEKLMGLLHELCEDINKEIEYLTKDCELIGITNFGEFSMTFVIRGWTSDERQWEIERIIRVRAMEKLQANEINL